MAVGEIMRTPEARALLLSQGAEPMPSTPQGTIDLLQSKELATG